MQKEYKRYLVTSALPYANGPIHIGHLAGVYVPADIYVRYLRLRGREVCFVGGSDEHGVPITIKARQLGVSPQDIVDTYHHQIKESFSRLGISFDVYSRTTSEIHHKTASAFFRKLYDEGKFLEKETEQYFDPEANTFLADRYITGTCPRCGHADAYGDQCEKCGSTLSPDELIDPKSSISGSIPEKRKTKHWYLPLDQYEPWLREWILENHKEWKPNVYGQCKSWLDNGLQPRAVSRDLDWGVPVPVEGASGKVLYVWFDAPIGYISNTIELYPDTWEKWWKDQDTKMIHFIGKDNIVFHCIVFPSMLKAHGGYILPENVPANEFLNLEGEKISTSRNWAVWLHEYLDEFPGKEDVLRYTLCSTTPETKDNDFTWKDFQSRNNNELVAILGNFVNRAVVLTHKYFKGTVPETGTLTPYDREVLGSVSAMKNALEEHLEHYRFRDSLKEAMNIARLGNKYLADTEPWKVAKTDMERVGTILNISLQLCARLTIALEPFLPFTTKKLRDILNITKAFPWSGLDNETLLQTDHQLNEPVLLFDKIDDDAIVLQTDKLKKPVVKKVVPASPECTIDDFEKMDIRVATVLHAERVPKTDKLLKLTIDTGLDRRVIVSGIAGYYTPEEMTGKQICILANLSPRTIRGIESQGMILMAKEPDGSMRVVSPEDKIGNGAVIG
ncbi:MAG: methionine--tRNA ligase [Bacteroidales bacterium]|jgi:methionyl-tRNA synthetase|nr:methionine--tRNA ligase [Bacteroidales bacterium]MDD5714326.1 methionine--tRNA ligase [Bacteroidales bacterium]MDY0358690.1 methionine--tRNA ligase [Bacteroidales bacterium]NLN37890.1 methionine--tRNA ligase [Bacteroidales bacterium]